MDGLQAVIEQVVHLDQALTTCYLATAVCVIYDHILTLNDEIEIVWKRPKWTIVQYLFIINRYLGDAYQIYNAFITVRHIVGKTSAGCNLNHIILIHTIQVIAVAMQGIILCRISSMYGHNRKLIAVLTVFIIIEFADNLVLNIMAQVYSIPIPQLPGVVSCGTTAPASWIWVMWFLPCFFEALVFFLALRVALQYTSLPTSRIVKGRRHSLLYVLLRDSLVFPLIALIIYIVNPIAWTRLPPWEAQFIGVFSSFLPCIIGPRLVLNLREAYYQPYHEEISLNTFSSSYYD